MKIVIVADIHGIFDALQALPEDYDELWVLGDLVNYGSRPRSLPTWKSPRWTTARKSNFYCHPGRAGGTPNFIRSRPSASGGSSERTCTTAEGKTQ